MQVRRSCRRTYLCCLSGRKSMSSLLQVLRERAEADRSCRRTYLCCLSGRRSMSSLLQVQRVRAEVRRSCHRTYLCCLSGRKNMSNQLLRELLQVLLSDQRRNLSEADPG